MSSQNSIPEQEVDEVILAVVLVHEADVDANAVPEDDDATA